jgi:hypothetical protein
MGALEQYVSSTVNLQAPEIEFEGLRIMSAWEAPIITTAARLICEMIQPDSVLEFGYGYGYTASVFRSYARRHRIVEIHPQLVEEARRKGFDCIQADVTAYLDGDPYDLLYDDHYPFPSAGLPKYSRYFVNWIAGMWQEGYKTGKGFSFQVEDQCYFQPLRKVF